MRYEPFEDCNLPPVPENESYGLKFPAGVNQFTKELYLFRHTFSGKQIGTSPGRYFHGINIIRMLWSNSVVALYSDKFGQRIWNTYFLNTFSKLCDGKTVALTGPASAAKSFTVAVYFLCCFFSAPAETSALISTTSAGAGQRRIWGYLKGLFNKSNFSPYMEVKDGVQPKIGQVVDYLNCITFNPDKEIFDQKKTGRDLRNGVVLIPIAQDSTGDNALDTIMGTHNTYVLWAIDEAPAMMDGVLKPRANLAANPNVQIIVIGNASYKSDPHGQACEPKDGWESIDTRVHREWKGRTMDVLLLYGEESPNDHPAVPLDIVDKSDFPFPYLSNRISREEIAYSEGNGDIALGRQTQAFFRFGLGIWAGDDVSNTILSEQYIYRFRANDVPRPWGPDGYETFWGLDPGFTTQGDDTIYFPLKFGRDIEGMIQVVFPHEGQKIKPLASTKEDFRLLTSKEVKKILIREKTDAKHGGMDAMADGGLLYKDITIALGDTGVQPISSLGPSNKDKYTSLVAEYWYGVAELIALGICRGFNINSRYAKDLFSRKYKSERGKISIEKKDDFKKRFKRSPNDGDACAYACFLIRSRCKLGRPENYEEQRKQFRHSPYIRRQDDSPFVKTLIEY